MRIRLDECVDARFTSYLSDFDTRTVHDKHWAGITNGKLLALAESEFEFFTTVDRNLRFQQHLPKFQIAVILLCAPSNRLDDLVTLLPELIEAIPTARPGRVTQVSG